MKKALTLFIVTLFLVAVAGVAYAADTTFQGQYRVRAWTEWNFDKKPGNLSFDDQHPLYTGYFDQRFRLTITHKRSEFLKAVVRLDLVEDTWGQQRNMRINNATDGSYVDWAYLEFTLPKIGTFTVGKQPLELGYGLMLAQTAPGDEGIRWANKWGPVGVSAFYFKFHDDVTNGVGDPTYNRDADLWGADLTITPNDKNTIDLWGGVLTDNSGGIGGWFAEVADDIYGTGELVNAHTTLGYAGVAYTGNIANMIDLKGEMSFLFGRTGLTPPARSTTRHTTMR